MSAYLDKSQGITFVFSNIHEIYRQAKNAKLDAPFVADRVISRAPAVERSNAEPLGRVIKAKEAKVEKFQPEEVKPANNERPFEVPMGVREAEEKAKALAASRPIASIQKHLCELNDAQSKLRFLLQELEALSKKKS